MLPDKKKIREKHLALNGLSVNNSAVGHMIQQSAYGAMEEYAKAMALAFYEHVESVPAEEMSSNYDFFILHQGKAANKSD